VGAILGCGLFVLPQYLRYVQDYSATQTGEFIVMYTSGLGTGLLLTLRVIQPRLGGPRTAALGFLLLIGTFTTFLYIWTPTTPGILLAPAIFVQGFALAPILIAAANIATGQAALPDLNDVSTTYFFCATTGQHLWGYGSDGHVRSPNDPALVQAARRPTGWTRQGNPLCRHTAA
jgi:DHA2 family multidrug resistance protein